MKGLRQKRKERNLTIREVAELLGVTLKTVYNYEAGKATPTLKTLKRLAEIFVCTIDDLM